MHFLQSLQFGLTDSEEPLKGGSKLPCSGLSFCSVTVSLSGWLIQGSNAGKGVLGSLAVCVSHTATDPSLHVKQVLDLMESMASWGHLSPFPSSAIAVARLPLTLHSFWVLLDSHTSWEFPEFHVRGTWQMLYVNGDTCIACISSAHTCAPLSHWVSPNRTQVQR